MNNLLQEIEKWSAKYEFSFQFWGEAWLNYMPTYDFEYNCNIWVKRGETLTLPRDWDKLIEYTKREKPKYKKMKLDIKGLDVEDLTERWSSQLAQIDCRLDTCTFYNGSGECTNPSPAITLNPSGKFTCWSKNEVEKPKYKNSSYYWVNDDGTWKPAQRGDKVWHFMHYAAREEDVMEVGEEIKRNK